MECSEPGAIREEELLAYLDGEKGQSAVGDHIARCQACSSRLAAYRRIDLKLVHKLYRWDCPSSQILGEYQLDLLSAELLAAVQSHLLYCVLCAAEVVVLSNFLAQDLMVLEPAPMPQERISVSPSYSNNHHSAHEARRVFDQIRDHALVGARRMIAVLVPPVPQLTFQRDQVSQNSTWPRRYTAADINISLQVAHGPHQHDALQLLGLAIRNGKDLGVLQGIAVQLSAQADTGSTVYTQNIDELGNFVFSALAPAIYSLQLQLPEGIIVIEQIPLAAFDEA